MTRREILHTVAAAFAVPLVSFSFGETREPILARIRPPEFPDRDFDITQYGARGDGKTKCTDAFTRAIVECHAAGGGRVVVPAGRFQTGAIHLLDNVNLHVTGGAALLFSTDTNDYPLVLTRYEGVECMNYSPFIYAFEKQNIAVTGEGTLDGQAGPAHWWPWAGRAQAGWNPGMPSMAKDRKALFEMGETDVPVEKRVFGPNHYLRTNFVQPYRCKNVLLDGLTLINSPMWEVNPVLCQNVTIRGLRVNSHGPNNDGCDPESCRDVLITNCTFSTGDDCIAVKSGRNRDGRRVGVPCENVVVTNCRMEDGHGGVSIGSEVSGGIRNVLVNNCAMSSPNLERALRVKTNSQRGGTIENIRFENVSIGEVKEAAAEIDFYYEEGAGGPLRPQVKDIYIGKVTSRKSKYGILLRGFPDAPITGVTIRDCDFENAAGGNVFQNVKQITAKNVLVNGKPLSMSDLEN